MGIDFSHCDAHWSYSGFHNFRKRLAAAIDIDLEEMVGFDEGSRSWDEYKDHPLHNFLNHSDCEGYLKPTNEMIDAIRNIIKTWPEDDYDRQTAEELLCGMQNALYDCSSIEFL